MTRNQICISCGGLPASEYFNLDNSILLCHLCAENIMEIVHMARYGEYIRRDNKPKIRNGYAKKKIPANLRAQVHEKHEYKCVTCGTQKDLTCDHIKPESLGGETVLDNLQTMCKSCNSSKGTKYE